MDTQNKTQTPSKKNRPAIIAAALGAALCLALAPLLTPQADASLDSGGFCIVAKFKGEEISGVAGDQRCVAPREEESAEEHETIDEQTTYLVERVDTAIKYVPALKGRSYQLTITRHAGGVSTVVQEEQRTVGTGGYSNNNVVFSSKRASVSDLPFYAPSYTIRYDFGGGEVYEAEVKPEHFTKKGEGSSRQDWTSRTDLTPSGWVRS